VAVRPIDPEALRVGRVLRAIREQQGLTQADVAAALKKGEGAYAAYESGRGRFTLPELPVVARALRVSTAYLASRLGFCGDDRADIAQVLVERFGPQIGQTLVRLDGILALMEAGDTAALDVTVRRYVEPYESGRHA
jgi:transcriptional regulator with XRE-family HTH domain